jgi:DNA-binding response OmpR family regulator
MSDPEHGNGMEKEGGGVKDNAESQGPTEAVGGSGTSATVLIVEDDPDSAELMGQILQLEGYKVQKANSGLDALAKVGLPGIDLILLDVMLPGVDGFEVCYRVRQNPATAHLPIVMVSAKGRREDIETGLRVGANTYMTKPLSRAGLIATVKKLLETPEASG